MQVRQSTASNLLDKLEERTFIRRERQTRDTRVVCLYLTPSGQAVVKDVPGPMQGRMRNALQQMSATELKGLDRGISRLMELLNASAH
jgi:DNA-binding MarR family transcriptional regulator